MNGRMPRSLGYVYVIDSDDGFTKVGWAVDPAKRRDDLQVANAHALSLRSCFSASQRVEREIHARLSALRVRGEWFRSCPRLYEVMRQYESVSSSLEATPWWVARTTRVRLYESAARRIVDYDAAAAAALCRRLNIKLPLHLIVSNPAMVCIAIRIRMRCDHDDLSLYQYTHTLCDGRIVSFREWLDRTKHPCCVIGQQEVRVPWFLASMGCYQGSGCFHQAEPRSHVGSPSARISASILHCVSMMLARPIQRMARLYRSRVQEEQERQNKMVP